MSYVLAGYGITAVAIAAYALSLARRLRGMRGMRRLRGMRGMRGMRGQ
jgi:hypothetical protein